MDTITSRQQYQDVGDIVTKRGGHTQRVRARKREPPQRKPRGCPPPRAPMPDISSRTPRHRSLPDGRMRAPRQPIGASPRKSSIARSRRMTDHSHIDRGMARGAAWMMLYKIVDRAIGLVSITILARLLMPADFGVVTLAASTLVLLEVLGAVGLDIALIQHRDAGRRQLDAAWTFNVLFGLVTAAVAIALAPVVAHAFGDPRLLPALVVTGASRALQGCENIGIIAFRRELRFEREFRYRAFRRVATSLLVTLPLAYLLRDYRAFVFGSLAGSAIGVAASYALHAYRPRLALAGLRELLHFSRWLYIANVADALHGRLADLIVGYATGTAGVGALGVARDVARLPREFVAPVHRAVFPGYVQLAGDRALLRRGYLKVTSALMLLLVPAGIGLALLAAPVTALVLGTQWTHAVPVVRLLAIDSIFLVLLSTAHHVNLAVGMSRSTTLVLLFDLAITLPLLLVLVPLDGIRGAALAALLGSICTAPLNLRLLARAIEFGRRELLLLLGRPLAGALGMAPVVVALAIAWPEPDAAAARAGHLLLLVGAGALTYFAIVLLLWLRAGEPDGPEAWAVRRLRAGWQALRVRKPLGREAP